MCSNITRFLRDAIGGVQRFGAHKAGSMATFAAIAAVPLIFSVGAGIDRLPGDLRLGGEAGHRASRHYIP